MKSAKQDVVAITPTVEAYFVWPPVWFSDTPIGQGDAPAALDPGFHHATVLQMTLSCGLPVRVQRDGLVAFEFGKWAPARSIVLPAIDPDSGITPARRAAEATAGEVGAYRAAVMNAHQVCLVAGQAIVGRRKGGGYTVGHIGNPVDCMSTIKRFGLDEQYSAQPYFATSQDARELARCVANNSLEIPNPQRRTREAINVEAVRESMSLLDAVLVNFPSSVVTIEMLYFAAHRNRERRFGESIVLSWTVCEQMIGRLWDAKISAAKAVQAGSVKRVSRDREKQLGGRDYSAAIRVQMLELDGVLDFVLFQNLEIARKARNAWAHSVVTPSEGDTEASIQAAEQLLNRYLGVTLSFSSSAGTAVTLSRLVSIDAVDGDRKNT